MRYGTKWLVAILAALVVIAVLVPSIAMGALGLGSMGTGMMGNGMTGGCPMAGSGMMGTCPASGAGMMAGNGWTQGLAVGLSGLATLAMWGALVAAVVLAIRWLIARTATDTEPLSILQRRYAAGEIDGITYAEIRAALNS
jgi:HAMP domain-containing protein